MISLLFAIYLGIGPARADEPFLAGRNISERLEAQGNRVGGCTRVTIFMGTLRSLDGDHEYLGVSGVTSAGQTFARAKEFGRTIGFMPRVRRQSDGTFRIYTYRRYPFAMDGWGSRRDIITLVVDGEGSIIDLVTPRGRRLCAVLKMEPKDAPTAEEPDPPSEGNATPTTPGVWM